LFNTCFSFFNEENKMKTNKFFTILMILALLLVAMPAASAGAAGTVTVTPPDLNGWAFVQETPTGTGSLVLGPGTPVMGSGSARFTLDSTGRELFGTLAYAGIRLDQITSLEYSTYRSSTDPGDLLAVTLQFDMDYDLTDADTAWQGRLVFEPYFTAGSGNIPEDTWQTWTPLDGLWWASGAPGNTVCPQAAPCTLASLLSVYQNAGLRAGVGVLQFKAGGPWAGFDGNVDAFTIGIGSDTTIYDFQPEPSCTTVCYADAVSGNDANSGASMADAKKTIQAAIDAVQAGGTVRVLPGTYNETAANRSVLGNGSYQFGLFIGKDGVTVQGVDASDMPLTDYNTLGAYITTNATNNFGYSGIFVEGDDVTIAGLRIGPNTPSDNKTIEIIGDGFTLRDSHVDVPGGGSVYFGDWQFNTGADTSHIQSYTVDHNLLDQSTSIDIASGAGYSGDPLYRQITNNEFENADNWPSISFTGSGTGVAWFVQSVGGAVIEGNTFTNTFNGTDKSAAHIRTRGVVKDIEFGWTSYWNNNDFNKAVVNLVGAYPPFEVRQYSYTSGSYTFNARRIGVNIQSGINTAQATDTVLVGAGTYVENVLVDKSVEIAGAGQGSTLVMPAVSSANPCAGSSLCGGTASNVFLVQASDVKIHDLTVDGDNLALTSGIERGGADLDARNGIIKNLTGTYNELDVYNTTVQNIYLRGIYSTGGTFDFHDNVVTNVQGDYASIAIFAWYGPGIMANNTVSYANDAISANHSKGIQFLNNIVTHSGSGVHTDNAGDSGGVADLIEGNSVSDCTAGGYGVWVFVPYIAPSVNNNTVTNCSVGLSAWGQANPVTTQFTNNTVTGLPGEAESVGVYLTTDWISYGYSDLSVMFSGNYISGFETGIYLTADEQSWNPEPYEAKTITASFLHNHISNNTSGLEKGTMGTYDATATYNWWGDPSGPRPVGPGSGNTIAAGVPYTPWFCVDVDTSADPGYQPLVKTDCADPITTNVLASPNPVAINGSVTVTANVDDSTTGSSNIASAEYSLDGGTTWAPMAASDGTFDEISEDVRATFTAPGTPGIYNLCARGTDAAQNTGAFECIMLVVYDPNGGFVTGGGWIDSPVNTNYPYMSVGGKATFGFVSKYRRGATVPDGNTEFQFKAGGLNFSSTSYQWLVVNQAGTNAQFKGTGTINGAGNYGFMLWAGDGSPDTFRIQIWDAATEVVVYDNGSNQPIGGGSIVVHRR
jgi:hypothetical protein